MTRYRRKTATARYDPNTTGRMAARRAWLSPLNQDDLKGSEQFKSPPHAKCPACGGQLIQCGPSTYCEYWIGRRHQKASTADAMERIKYCSYYFMNSAGRNFANIVAPADGSGAIVLAPDPEQ